MSSKLTRRELLRSGAGLASAALGLGCGSDSAQDDSNGTDDRPDMLILLTDQERHHTHWPDGLLEKLMPSWGRLESQGVKFERAYCSASQCSPSRACLWTGQYGAVNGVPYLDQGQVLLKQSELPSLATVLRQAGYDVVYKGKWHLSYPKDFTGTDPTKEQWTAADAEVLRDDYGFFEWNPPESGHNAFNKNAQARASWGGGDADNDGRTVSGVTSPLQTPGFGESVLDFVARMGSTPRGKRPPFCLVVSLVNPHDIAFFPDGYDEGGYRLEDFENLGVALPANHADSLVTKPSIQLAFRDSFEAKVSISDPVAQARYVNFYGYLHGVVEPHIQQVLDAFDQHGLTESTVIVRTADHGEMGLSHGLREKAYTAYEETIHVPLVIAYPGRFPAGATTNAFWSHVDLIATLAELAGAPPTGVGKSQVPVLQDPSLAVREDVLFTYDDNFLLEADFGASHIRALREDRYTYAVYFSADGSKLEFELYDHVSDPGQLRNLLYRPKQATTPVWRELHTKLAARMKDTKTVPAGFSWPDDPTA